MAVRKKDFRSLEGRAVVFFSTKLVSSLYTVPPVYLVNTANQEDVLCMEEGSGGRISVSESDLSDQDWNLYL